MDKLKRDRFYEVLEKLNLVLKMMFIYQQNQKITSMNLNLKFLMIKKLY